MLGHNFRRRLAAIGQNPHLLDEPDPLHLGAFYYGYSFIANELAWLDLALEKRFPAPPVEARAWSRVHLQYEALDGLRRLVAVADELLAVGQEPRLGATTAPSAEPAWWVTVVADVVRQQRIGMILGECSLSWLYNYGRGSDAALQDVFPEIAAERVQQFSAFEQWLQGSHQAPGAPWHRILRVVYGPGATGVEAFGAAWEEYAGRTSETIKIR